MKILSQEGAEKEDKKAEGFQILHFYWLFLSDIMAVKGLMQYNTRTIDEKLIIFGSVCCSYKTWGRGGEVVQSERTMTLKFKFRVTLRPHRP